MKSPAYCSFCGETLIQKTIEGKPRLACPKEECDYVFWDNPIPVVAALIEYDGRVLLVRNKGWPRNMFGLVTGFLEKGETAEAGVEREVLEELNLHCNRVELIGVYAFMEMNQLIVAYHIEAEGEVVIGDELEQIKLVEIEKLKPWPFGTGLAVQDWLDKRHLR